MFEDILSDRISSEEAATLAELGFLVADPVAEKASMPGWFGSMNRLDHIFAAKITMNLDCNLACAYCFEGQRKGKLYLSRDTADQFVEFVKGHCLDGKEELRITFYGGEPLLSVDLIEYLSQRLKTLAEDRGLRYSGCIITNGTLLSARNAGRLLAAGVTSASITLDGPRHIHDVLRPFMGGSGSFDAIVRNLREVSAIMGIEIGGNFTRENYKTYPLLFDDLMNEGLTADKIDLVRFDPVTSEREGMAPPGFHEGCCSLNEPWLFDAAIYLREETLLRGYKVYQTAPMSCLMELRDRIVVNYDGSIYKCPGLIGRQEVSVGDIWSGMGDYSSSHSLDNWKNEECLDCAYLPLCFGGCRYMKLVRAGNMNGLDCRREFFDATLEAFVKQDMKYGLVG